MVEITLTTLEVARRTFPGGAHRVEITDVSFDGTEVQYDMTYDGVPRTFTWDIPGTTSGLNVTAGRLTGVRLEGDRVIYTFE